MSLRTTAPVGLGFLLYSPFSSSIKKTLVPGYLGGSVGWASDFSSGHDLTAVGLSPTSGSVLTAQSLEPASHSVSPSLSAPSLLARALSLSNLNKH